MLSCRFARMWMATVAAGALIVGVMGSSPASAATRSARLSSGHAAAAVTSKPAARAAAKMAAADGFSTPTDIPHPAPCDKAASAVMTCVQAGYVHPVMTAAGRMRPANAATTPVAVGPSECGISSATAVPVRRDVSRFEVCRGLPFSWKDVDQNGVDHGAQNILVVEWISMAPNTLSIRRGLSIYAFTDSYGDYGFGGLHLSAALPCDGSQVSLDGTTCTTPDTGPVVDKTFALGDTYDENWSEKIALGTQQQLTRFLINFAEVVTLHGTSPNPDAKPLHPDVQISGNDEWRCDRVVAGAGCVDPDFAPNAIFDATLNPLVGPVAHHMLWAQNTLVGNPGKPGGLNPLTRVSEDQRAINYTKVCGSSSSRFVPDPPTNTSCDEYPFASSSQGGDPTTTSVSAVPKSANDSQGGLLNGQYSALRILIGDNYYVQVILADPRTGGVIPSSSLQNQFNTYSNNAKCADWSGGDATNSVALPDGQRAWFFSDSYLGAPADRKTFFYTSNVHNSVVIQNGSSMRTITGGNTCQERNTSISFFDRYAKNIANAPDANLGGFYWTGDQQLVGSNVVKFYYHGYPYANSFVNDYGAVASIPAATLETNPTLSVTPTKLNCAAGGPPALWGTMTLNWTAKDGYYYIYGTGSTTPHQLYLARAQAADLTNFSAWEFFVSSNGDGTAEWSPACDAARALPIGNMTGGSVNYINGTVWLIQEDYQPGSLTAGTIDGHPSDTPWGFSSRHITLYSPPEGHYDYPYYYLVYEPRIQEGLSSNGNLVLSYNVNTAGVDTGCASASTYDASAYRPRFIEIPPSWFNTYDAPQGLDGANGPNAIKANAFGATNGQTAMDGRTVLHNPTRDPGVVPPAPTASRAATAATGIGGITDWFAHFGSPCPTIAAPNPLTVAAQPTGYANLAWKNMGTDVWYYVYECDASAGSCATTSSCSSNTGGYTAQLGGLWVTLSSIGVQAVTSSSNQGHHFIYYVCSSGAQNPNPIGTSGNGAASTHVAANVSVAAPKAPTNVKASRSGATFTVSWTAVTYPSSQVIYTPYYRDITAGWPTTFVLGAQPVQGVTTEKFTVPNASDKYEIYVQASNIGGNSPVSNKVQL